MNWRTMAGLPIHVFIVALLVPVHIFAHNLNVLKFEDAFLGALLYVFLAGVFYMLSYVFVKEKNRAGLAALILMASVWLLLFGKVWLLLTLVVLGGGVLFLAKKFIDARLTMVLNIVSLALLAMPVYNLLEFYSMWDSESTIIKTENSISSTVSGELNAAKGLPSIVHIVLDGYASNPALKKFINYDNSGFSQTLEDMGFVVFDKASTPYNQTLFAMASIFNGDYLEKDTFPLNLRNPLLIRKVLGSSVTDGYVKNQLLNLGYKSIVTDTGYAFFPFSEDDEVITPQKDEQGSPYGFLEKVVQKNAITRMILDMVLKVQVMKRDTYTDELLKYVLSNTEFYKNKPPLFIYQHLLAPHPPFTIDRHGNPSDRWPEFTTIRDGDHATLGRKQLKKKYAEGYREKLMFANAGIERQLRDMLQSIAGPKIIIIHGDHGSGTHLFQETWEQTCFEERFSPFLAIYSDVPELKEVLQNERDSNFNLVNLYRLILGKAFALDLPMLEDKNFFVAWNSMKITPLTKDQVNKACEI